MHANPVSLCKKRPQDSRIRNILPTTITEIIHSESSDNVQVKLAFGNDHIWANITPWASDDLALTVGQSVYVQTKGVSMTESELAQLF
ncbi:TOBE domain-containing protein [Moritella sp.]|uniref:TOBE domain-containing protein n=1 Tax=Moritella sp. TaxID=78556 RepID=UPI003458C38A